MHSDCLSKQWRKCQIQQREPSLCVKRRTCGGIVWQCLKTSRVNLAFLRGREKNLLKARFTLLVFKQHQTIAPLPQTIAPLHQTIAPLPQKEEAGWTDGTPMMGCAYSPESSSSILRTACFRYSDKTKILASNYEIPVLYRFTAVLCIDFGALFGEKSKLGQGRTKNRLKEWMKGYSVVLWCLWVMSVVWNRYYCCTLPTLGYGHVKYHSQWWNWMLHGLFALYHCAYLPAGQNLGIIVACLRFPSCRYYRLCVGCSCLCALPSRRLKNRPCPFAEQLYTRVVDIMPDRWSNIVPLDPDPRSGTVIQLCGIWYSCLKVPSVLKVLTSTHKLNLPSKALQVVIFASQTIQV